MAKRKFKVGDKVRIKNFDKRPCCWNREGKMDYLMGKEIRIEKFFSNGSIEVDGRWAVSCNEVELVDETIVLYRKDNKVIALDKSTGKKAEACCNPADEFDFYIGAKLAFKRLMGEPEEVGPDKPKEVKRPAEVEEFIKIVNEQHIFSKVYENGDIGKVTRKFRGEVDCCLDGVIRRVWDSEYVVLENYKPEEKKEPFKPYLSYEGKPFGTIGAETPMKDVVGRSLRIGDTVELFNEKGKSYGENAVVFYGGKAYVMGIMGACREYGIIDHGWNIVLKRRHEEIEDGEKVGSIEYIKTER